MAPNARPRKVIITINYRFTKSGRRTELRQEIRDVVVASIVRRMERTGIITVDDVDVREV